MLEESVAENWPTPERAPDPSGKNETLGIPGPRTQYEGIGQVGSQCGGMSMRTEEPPEGGLHLILEDIEPQPWIFQCSCGIRRSVRYERLVDMVRETLARSDHHLTLP